MVCVYDAKRPPEGLRTIFSWWEEVENGGEDGPKKGGPGRAGGHLNGRRLLQAAVGLLLTPVMIGCLCGEEATGLRKMRKIKTNNQSFFSSLSVTHVRWRSLSCQPCW